MSSQANQTQIPAVQTPDNAMNQVQQNVNKVFRNLNNQIVEVQDSLGNLTIIGEIKLSPLTLAEFQEQASNDWIAANGQSCVGTKYNTVSGNTTVPNISVSGTNAFIRVN
jgi:hypothetical protein